jgi:hypothetical protein
MRYVVAATTVFRRFFDDRPAAFCLYSVTQNGAHSDPAKRGGARDRGTIIPQETLNVSQGALSKARVVLRYSADPTDLTDDLTNCRASLQRSPPRSEAPTYISREKGPAKPIAIDGFAMSPDASAPPAPLSFGGNEIETNERARVTRDP